MSIVKGHTLSIASLALVVAAALASSAPAFAEPTRCDVLAGHPLDPHKVTPGVAFTNMNAREAVAACRDAVKKDAQNPRLRFELGRALERSGAYTEAVEAYHTAAVAGYAPAQNAMGAMFQDGLGVKQDKNEAEAWFQKAADQGYQPALAALLAMTPAKAAPASQESAPNAAPAATPAAPRQTEPPPEPLTPPRPVPVIEPQAPPPPPAERKAEAPVAPPPAPPQETAAAPPPAPPPPEAQAQPPQPVPQGHVAALPPQPPTPPPAAPEPSPAPKQEAAIPPPAPAAPEPMPTDPQFNTPAGNALTQCILPEAQGKAALDDNQATNLLVGKCQRPWLAWVSACVDQGDSKESCIRRSTNFARAAVKQSNTTN